MTLLAGRRDVAPHSTEGASARICPEAAGDFLLKLHHPQVAFRAVIIERHTDVSHEAEDFIALTSQPVDDSPRRW